MHRWLLFLVAISSNILASRIALETIYKTHNTTCNNEYAMRFSLDSAEYKVQIIDDDDDDDDDDSESNRRIVKIEPEDEKVRFFDLVSAKYWDARCVGAESGQSTPFDLRIHEKRTFNTRNGNYISKVDLSKIPDDSEDKDVRILVPVKNVLYNTDPDISEVYHPELERFVHELSSSPKDHVRWKCSEDNKTVLILIIYDDDVARIYTRIDFTDPENPKTHGAQIMMGNATDTIKYTDFCSEADRNPINGNANLLKVLNNNDLDNGRFCSTIPSGFRAYNPQLRFSDRYDYQSVNYSSISNTKYIIGFRLPKLDEKDCVNITSPNFLDSMYIMPLATNESQNEKNNNITVIIVCAACGGVVLTIGLIFVIYMCKNKSYGEEVKNNTKRPELVPEVQNEYENPSVKVDQHGFDDGIVDEDQKIENNPNDYHDANI